jgi:hypothetical protein
MWVEAVEAIRNSPNPDRVKNTIFEGILSSKLPDEEKSTLRLAQEAQLVVFAGEGTTGEFLLKGPRAWANSERQGLVLILT